MSITTLILGESGTGKSTSLRDFDPEKTLLIQAVKKPLPFRSANWKPVVKGEGGSVFHSDNSEIIIKAMERTQKEIIVIDDAQFIMANEFLRRATDVETGNAAFAKYNEIAQKTWNIYMKASELPDNKRVYILSHSETNDFGKTKIKTIGKLLDEKIVLEGLVTIVLRTMVSNGEYFFSTKNSGSDTVKSPIGLFESESIENNLANVDKAICEYYGIN